MTKTAFGLILGASLGILDGLTAWFTPEVRIYVAGIMIASVLKDASMGAICGRYAHKKSSLRGGILVGLATGCALSTVFALLPSELPFHMYAAIIVPGTVTGLILGIATQIFREKNADPGKP